MRALEVCFVPGSLVEAQLREKTAVVIDVLRASTSICTAIQNGCRQIVPVPTPERAFQLKEELGDEEILLCGERAGMMIEGFNLGNSPAEYEKRVVADKTLIFASTNGSGAIVKCRSAAETLVGGFVNATAVVEYVNTSDRELGNDAARTARLLYNSYAPRLAETVRDCDHGRYLVSLGFGDDIASATALDDNGAVPVLRDGKLVAA